MASVHDVAACILEEAGKRITAMMLEKLVYYSQAWSLVWDDKPLFAEPIEAWEEGPVVRTLWEAHRGARHVSRWPHGSSKALTPEQKRTIRAVVRFYGERDAEWLSQLTHRESPWCDARGGTRDGGPSRYQIKNVDMRRFYGAHARHLGFKKQFPKKYARTLDLLVGLAPDEIDTFHEDAKVSPKCAIAWLETGENDPCASSG
jgi:uncharacterized phage-associated protein